MLVLTLICAASLTGCATGTHIVTGQTRTRIKPEQVTLYYQNQPSKFEIIGIVNARSPGKGQHNMDDAVNVLKEQAAKIGANGVIIGTVNPGSESIGFGSGSGFNNSGASFFGSGVSSSSSGIQLSGTAIYVAP
jgi:hypothetical protein